MSAAALHSPRYHLLAAAGALVLWWCLSRNAGLLAGTLDSHESATPATQPASPSQMQMRAWVTQLGSDSPEQRDDAIRAMMNLRKDDLPALKAVAIEEGPLLPEQRTGLREVARQVFLASIEYPANLKMGFLGLSWPPVDTTPSDQGLVVSDRVPGFAAFQMLRPGDIILKLVDHPEIDVRNREVFTHAVGLLKPEDSLRLQILRSGRQMDVSVVLAARPVEVDNIAELDIWLQHRNELFDKYWNAEFASIDPDLSPKPATQP